VPQSQAEPKKIKITFEEYQKIAYMVMDAIRELKEEGGEDSVSQAQIVNKLVQHLELQEGSGTSLERSLETSKKISNVIQHLITKENVLMITQDAKVKNERLICLNINVDMQNMDLNQ
jgi:rRNA-processing protein FCF1